MRFIKYILMILFCSLMLTGCGKRILSCSKTTKLEAGQVIEKQSIIFQNNTPDEYTSSFEFKINDNFKDFEKGLFESLESSFKKYDNMKGINYNIQKDNNKFLVTIKYEYDKISSKVKDSLGLSKNVTFTKVLNSLEADEYSCKH